METTLLFKKMRRWKAVLVLLMCSLTLAVPEWLVNLGEGDMGTWSMHGGAMTMSTGARMAVSATGLDGQSGAFRVKSLCGEKVAWLSWNALKLEYVDRYTKREAKLLEFMCSVIDLAESPFVMDLGANHGLYALLAAAKGAKVRAVEAQGALASLLRLTAEVNGLDLNVLHNAILDVNDFNDAAVVQVPEMAQFHRSEGGTASLGRQVANVPNTDVSTMAASALWHNETVSFLKIDVEGLELAALRSAMPIFENRKVQHAAIEFGPTSRSGKNTSYSPTIFDVGGPPSRRRRVSKTSTSTPLDSYFNKYATLATEHSSVGI